MLTMHETLQYSRRLLFERCMSLTGFTSLSYIPTSSDLVLDSLFTHETSEGWSAVYSPSVSSRFTLKTRALS